MKPVLKILLLAEVVICFGPAFIILLMGLVVIPVALESLVNGHMAGVYLLAMLLGGWLGMAALISLVIKILEPDSRTLSPRKILLFMSFGILAVSGFLVMAGEGGGSWQLGIASLPLAASVHLIYLGRNYVFGKNY
ncbi:hypothetical protein [Marinobacter nitratireducens]|uniref:hypothetical protein n=1 Tax=Marinobacter nitratireducens TaxID=1137280 RepID=UPI0005635138|nr:hypothetical protein [Marinobacter nitratireducens]